MKKITKILGLAAMLSAAVFIGCAPVTDSGSGSGTGDTTPSGTTPGYTVPGVSAPVTDDSVDGMIQDVVAGAIAGKWNAGVYTLYFYTNSKGFVEVATPSIRAYKEVGLSALTNGSTFTWKMKTPTTLQVTLDKPVASNTTGFINFTLDAGIAGVTLSAENVKFVQDKDTNLKDMREKVMTTPVLEFVTGETVDPTDPNNADKLKSLIASNELTGDLYGRDKFVVMWKDTSNETRLNSANVWVLDLVKGAVDGPFASSYAVEYSDMDKLDDDTPTKPSTVDSILLSVPCGAGGSIERYYLDKADFTDKELADADVSAALTTKDQSVEDPIDTVGDAEAALVDKTFALTKCKYDIVLEKEGSNPVTYEIAKEQIVETREEFLAVFGSEDSVVTDATGDDTAILLSAKYYVASNKYKVALEVLEATKGTNEFKVNKYVGTYDDAGDITAEGVPSDITNIDTSKKDESAVANDACTSLPLTEICSNDDTDWGDQGGSGDLALEDLYKYKVTSLTYAFK